MGKIHSDPIQRFKEAFSRAAAKGLALPNAASLATVGADGRPSVRMVLLKGADDPGFVFYTNLQSRKARELATAPFASLCVWWEPLEEQVRIEGAVARVTDAEADAYFATRPRGSQLGAWVSRQSEILSFRNELMRAFQEIEHRYKGKSIPRPSFWSGFRLIPDKIEFWLGKPDRLHERTLYVRSGRRWTTHLLYP